MSLLVARAFLWRQRAYSARTSSSPLLASLRLSSSETENTRKEKAGADAAGENKWARRAALGAAVGTLLLTTSALFLGAAYLAYDELTHSQVFVRWRMKRILRAGPPDDALSLVPEDRRFTLAEPRLLAGTPLLILGPSGSGKSSLMAKMVSDLKAKKVPVSYFSTRTAL